MVCFVFFFICGGSTLIISLQGIISVYFILKGFRDIGTTGLVSLTAERIHETTPKSAEIITLPGKPLDNPIVSNAVIYIIITLVCIFLILFALFVAVYFYKHCFKQSAIITDDLKDVKDVNTNEGYKCLDQLDDNQVIENLRDSTYLEPVFEGRQHYDEIENNEEIVDPGFVKIPNEEIIQQSPCPKSPHFLVHVPNVIVLNCDDTTSCDTFM